MERREVILEVDVRHAHPAWSRSTSSLSKGPRQAYTSMRASEAASRRQ
jgi:hypothetical protein